MPPVGITDATAIAAGVIHSCLLRAAGSIQCFGDNSWGQASVPDNLPAATAVSAGYYHTVALLANGSVVAWGAAGLLDVPPGLPNDVSAVSVGYNHTVALLANGGGVRSWGSNDYGQLDPPAGLTRVIAVSAGYYHTLALRLDTPPVAADHAFATNKDAMLTVSSTPGLLSGATDAEGDAVTSVATAPVSGPSHGSVTIYANGSFVYAPVANFVGTNSFTYIVKDVDGVESAPATVLIAVGALLNWIGCACLLVPDFGVPTMPKSTT